MAYALVIDDSRQAAEALVKILGLFDLQTKTTLNPATAMAILEKEKPEVIFLDINMPGVDGFEVLGYLNREPRLIGVPVIVVTSDDQQETRQRAINNGASAVIIKPVMVETLEAALKAAGVG